MGAVAWVWGCREKVAAGFADVLDYCGVGLADVAPEGLCAEFVAEGECAAGGEDLGYAQDGGGAVVQGHAGVEAVGGEHAEEVVAEAGAVVEFLERYDGGFGHSGGATGDVSVGR